MRMMRGRYAFILLPLLLHIVPVLLEPHSSNRGGGSRAAEALALRTEALQKALEQIRLEAEALAEDACARQAHAPEVAQVRTGADTAASSGEVGEIERDSGTAAEPAIKDHALGLRMLQPLDGEILHFGTAHYRFEAFLPPTGDLLFTITLDGRPSQHFSRCSWSCPHGSDALDAPRGAGVDDAPGRRDAHAGCSCRCTGTCDCERCERTTYSEVIRITAPQGILEPGIHTLSVQLRAMQGAHRQQTERDPASESSVFDPREMGARDGLPDTRLSVMSHFRVVRSWTSALRALLPPTASGERAAWRGVDGPRFPIAGLQYSMIPHQAAGLGALWPGVAIHSPHPGQVFRSDEGVTIDLEILDFELPAPDELAETGRGDGYLRVSIAVQNEDDRCAEFAGCRVSSRLSLDYVGNFLQSQNAWHGPVLTCDEDDCSRQKARRLPLDPGAYRLYAQLYDHAGREVSSERERAFFVRHQHPLHGDPRRDAEGWFCDPAHCLASGLGEGEGGGADGDVTKNEGVLQQVGETEREEIDYEHTGTRALRAPGAKRRGRVLLVYEWPPMAQFNGDADRLRQLITALDVLQFEVYAVARNCVGAQGDYLTKAPRAVGPRLSCGLTTTDIPAYLTELREVDLVLLVSTFWFYPNHRSFPELWIPFLRESPAARAAKIVVMGDVVTCPGGFALDEQADENVQAHGAQMIGFAGGDAIAVELADDAPWLRRVFSDVPVLPVRFISTAPPLPPQLVPGFADRKGLVWVGSAHHDNQMAVEFVARWVLPLVRARVGPDEGFLVVVGGGTEGILALQGLDGVEVLGHMSDVETLLAKSKVCVSPTTSGRPRFQTKHLQALARGVPVVTTEKGSLGYHIPVNTSAPHEHYQPCPSAAHGTGVESSASGPLNVRLWNETCGWISMSERECTELLGCCWVGVRGEGGGERAGRDGVKSGRCVRSVGRYEAGHGLVVGAPGLLRPADDDASAGGEGVRAEIDGWEAALLADAIVPLLVNAELWELESKGALRLVEENFQEKHLLREMQALVRAVGISSE
eukprot:Tamp_04707.p1 GENE.Tamp_04707~~Tamp_04707.p1  ORF type:complete len:1040 (-),score=137.79 Tamp_04707:29-3148(-)